MGQTGTMRALIALLCWLALSVPLALLVSRLIGTTGGSDGVGDEAERWLRSLVPARHRVRDAVLRSALAVIVLAPVAVGGLVAVWQLPDAVTVARADGQLALSWPPGQPDQTTTSTTTAPALDAGAAAEPITASADAASASAAAVARDPAPLDDPPPAPAPAPPDAGGGETGAPALVEEEPEPKDADDDEACDSSGKGSAEERCDDEGEGDEGDDDTGHDGKADDGTTTTTTEPPADDGEREPVSPVPYRSSTALLTGVR